MNKKLVGFLGAGLMLAIGANAYALGITTGVTGSVSAALGAAAVSSSGAQASGTTGTQVNAGLQAEVETGAIATSSDEAIVELQGGALDLIQTNDDLSAYNDLVIKARPAVKSVNVNTDGSMDIGYSQPAKFLGMFNASLTSDVHVDANGTVTVSTPWYGFLYAADTTPVQSSVAAAVQQSGAQLGAQASASTQAEFQDKAMLVNAITAAIQAEAQASASGTASVR